MLGILHEDLCTFMVTHPLILLRMRNVSGKFVEKIKKFLFIFFFENRAVCKIMWNNAEYTIHCHNGY